MKETGLEVPGKMLHRSRKQLPLSCAPRRAPEKCLISDIVREAILRHPSDRQTTAARGENRFPD